MLDQNTILQVLTGLMKNPSILNDTEKYNLSIEDFPNIFYKYIFSAIYNLQKNGAKKITIIDLESYLNLHQTAKTIYDREKGSDLLLDAMDFCELDNFEFYYNRLKKINCLKDLQSIGIDTSNFYCENLLNPKAQQINEKFDKLSISDIFNEIKKKIYQKENSYNINQDTQTKNANDNIEKLVNNYKLSPEAGAKLQGEIFNTVCRGARKTKFYIRTASSGVGKTRAALGDACYLSYPIKYSSSQQKWVLDGSNEKTLFIATEQEIEEIQTLILSYLTDINEEKILYGTYTEKEEQIIKEGIEVMNHYKDNLLIVRLSNPNIQQLKTIIRENWLMYDINNVFYDYIFSSPSLLNEFRDLKVREDIALAMLSTALKDLAVEMGIFIMSSTQTNAKSEEKTGIKNELVIRGARSIIDKCDIACVISRVTSEELEMLSELTEQIGIIPNQVADIYKVRRGRYNNIRIWSYVDLGTCRKKDLFATDEKFRKIQNFEVIDFNFSNYKIDNNNKQFINKLNQDKIEKNVNNTNKLKELINV